MKKKSLILTTLSFALFLGSCKKSDDSSSVPSYTVPATYNFTNVNTSNQQKLLAMADQIVAAINLGNTANTQVSAQTLKDMFNNAGSHFNDSALALNASGLKLSDYCSAAAKTDMLNYFDSIGVYSQSAVAAAHGTAGVAASSANPNKKLLLSGTGLFYSQIVKKTIMGICAYQIANVYLTDSISNSVDNNTVIAGNGTAMEHHWDEAFGWFSVPVTFPATTSGSKYYGSYSNQVDPGLHSNATLMNAFLKGRAAISNKDLSTKDAQAAIIIRTMELLNAACIVQEMKETDANIDAGDAVAAYGTMSETVGFIRSLKYNTSSTRIITNAQIAQLEALLDSNNPGNPDMYNFIGGNISSATQIKAKTDAIRQFIGNIYGFSASELSLL